tara:strand:+ start:693 stop:1292 length:600 start_codon:yes stop_codon:yes gene_type:complete
MCLGASRVEGNRPMFESFRYDLWTNLKRGGYSVDFIGSNYDNSDYVNYDFDRDHEGHKGYTSTRILKNINNWISVSGAPDIVLFSSPLGNDILSKQDFNKGVNNIKSIIKIIHSHNNKSIIIIEQPATCSSDLMTDDLENTFERLNKFVYELAKSDERIISIDIYSGFKDVHLSDGVHYNKLGAGLVAERYYNALIKLL